MKKTLKNICAITVTRLINFLPGHGGTIFFVRIALLNQFVRITLLNQLVRIALLIHNLYYTSVQLS